MATIFDPILGRLRLKDSPSIGGSVSGGTSGSVLYVDVSGNLAQDNANFFWDETNHRLGLGNAAPSKTLHVGSSSNNMTVSSTGIMTFNGTGVYQISTNTYAFQSSAAPLAGIFFSGTTNAFEFRNLSGGTEVVIDGTGSGTSYFNRKLGIGTTLPSVALELGTTTTGQSEIINAGLGSEQAPALTSGNWTVGTGWESPIVGPGLIKNADGTGTQTPSAATTIVSGTTYKVVITVSSLSVGSATYTVGGTTGTTLNAVGTFTDYIPAQSTGKLIINPTNTSRFTISAISIIPLTAGTGDISVFGKSHLYSPVSIGKATPVSGYMLDVDGNFVISAPATTNRDVAPFQFNLRSAAGTIDRFHIVYDTGATRLVLLDPTGTEQLRIEGTTILGTGGLSARASSGNIGFVHSGTTFEFLTDGNSLVLRNGTSGSSATRFLLEQVSSGTGNFLDCTDSTVAVKYLSINSAGVLSRYANVATAGWGVPAIYGSARSTGQTAAVASVAAYIVGSADGSFIISSNANITAFVAGTFNVQVAYTDETNTAQTLKLNFSSVTGTLGIALAATGPFEGIPANIRCKASTSITISTTGTFTSLTYNVEGYITQIG